MPSPEAGAVGTPGFGGPTMVLQSSAFAAGTALPGEYTCDGPGGSPPLEWSGVPPGARAFALIEQDADAVAGGEGFTHWLVYNLPLAVTKLDAGVPPRPLLLNGGQQGLNGQRTIGYAAPCPPRGGPVHHFSFELFAQDGYLTLETGAGLDEVRSALQGHALARAMLVATFAH